MGPGDLSLRQAIPLYCMVVARLRPVLSSQTLSCYRYAQGRHSTREVGLPVRFSLALGLILFRICGVGSPDDRGSVNDSDWCLRIEEGPSLHRFGKAFFSGEPDPPGLAVEVTNTAAWIAHRL
ncbi:MAG: hypothetical protein CM1200mP18_19180 [Gammaproteobacteria bacterium]|nr:MAG: hypothetical protein CM1200mP18_19180 [Gammaproteobacteria bacterium]